MRNRKRETHGMLWSLKIATKGREGGNRWKDHVCVVTKLYNKQHRGREQIKYMFGFICIWGFVENVYRNFNVVAYLKALVKEW